MSNRQSLPAGLHTADYFQKTKVLRSAGRSARRAAWSPRVWVLLFMAALVLILVMMGPLNARAAQQYHYSVTAEAGATARVDMPVDAPLDLTSYLFGLAGTLDPATLQVVEVDTAGIVLNSSVQFQFDAAADFDAATNIVGNLVFVMNDTTPAMSTRHYRVLFDVVGSCGDCPAAPAVPVPTTVDSLMYENQMTYLVSTPRADYYYHKDGAGLASIIDNDGQDWIGFHDIGGSNTAGEYRGIPNLVFTLNDADASFFHPGFDNATSHLVSQGPLKVAVRSVTNDGANEWILLWEFYQSFARLTVEQTGTSNGGDYWFLYEGTPGGGLDMGDVVVRSDGTITSAMDNGDQWEMALADPQWLYFHDTAAARYLYVSDDMGDNDLDSYRSQGQTSSSTPEMCVFGLGRVMNTTANSLVPRMSGSGRTFTIGLGEDNTTAATEITGAYLPLNVAVGDPVSDVSAVGDELPRGLALSQNYPNPFNPATTISFSLANRGAVNLSVYDAAGRLVRTLIAENLASGPHAVLWDGQDESGRMAASGIYLYRLVTPDHVLRGKMTLVE